MRSMSEAVWQRRRAHYNRRETAAGAVGILAGVLLTLVADGQLARWIVAVFS